MSKLSESQKFRILDSALENGINSFDTAPLYGNSEAVLGKFAQANKVVLDVTTKFGLPRPRVISPQYVRESVEKSVENLRGQQISTLFIHSLPFSLIPNSAIEELDNLKNQGLFTKLGFSGDNDQLFEYRQKIPNLEFMMSLNFLDMSNLFFLNTLNPKVGIHIKRPFANAVWRKQHMWKIQRMIFTLLRAGRGKETDSYDFRFSVMRRIVPDLIYSPLNVAIDFITAIMHPTRIVIGSSNTKHIEEISRLFQKSRSSINEFLFQELKEAWSKTNTYDWRALR